MNLVVIGAGPGGYVAALKAAQLGASVTVIERDEVGGTCLNWGCIPTKSLLASAEALAHARRLDEFGIDASGDFAPNLARIMERKNRIVATQAKGIHALFKSWGVALVKGNATIESPTRVAVSAADGTVQTLNADRIIIATGSRPANLPAFPFDGRRIISSNEAVHLSSIPSSVIIVGAGVIGCEFACILREFGCAVTMIEAMPRALMTEDAEIAELFEKELKKKKIKLIPNAKVTDASVTDNGVAVALESGTMLSAETVLVSVGRAYNTDGLGLEALGIARGARGEIVVNERMETTIPGVYAVGDVTGGILLAHVASKEGTVAASNACGVPVTIDYSVVPAAVFTLPEIGSVGLREHQAQERSIPHRIGRFPVRGLGKAHAMGEIAGLLKIIAHDDTDRILGVHIIGPHAADLIHEGAMAMQAGLAAQELASMIHAHPTLAEGLMEAAEELHGNAIHVPKKSA